MTNEPKKLTREEVEGADVFTPETIDKIINSVEDEIKGTLKRVAPQDFGPLVERAPEQVRDAIKKAYDHTADMIEKAAEEHLQRAIEHRAHAKDLAELIRTEGDKYSAVAFDQSEKARGVYRVFQEQRKIIKGEDEK